MPNSVKPPTESGWYCMQWRWPDDDEDNVKEDFVLVDAEGKKRYSVAEYYPEFFDEFVMLAWVGPIDPKKILEANNA